jgi:hypothetical protein
LKIKTAVNGLMLLFLVLYIARMICLQEKVYAADGRQDIYEKEIYDSKGNPRTIILMQNGEITITTNAHAAADSSTIRWKLAGFTITKEPLAKCTYDYKAEECTYHLNGYSNVNTVYEYGWSEMFFNNAFRRSSTVNNETGMKTTVTEFNSSQVNNAMKEDFSNVKADTILYLHGIFLSIL